MSLPRTVAKIREETAKSITIAEEKKKFSFVRVLFTYIDLVANKKPNAEKSHNKNAGIYSQVLTFAYVMASFVPDKKNGAMYSRHEDRGALWLVRTLAQMAEETHIPLRTIKDDIERLTQKRLLFTKIGNGRVIGKRRATHFRPNEIRIYKFAVRTEDRELLSLQRRRIEKCLAVYDASELARDIRAIAIKLELI